jgi:hypothetical protein
VLSPSIDIEKSYMLTCPKNSRLTSSPYQDKNSDAEGEGNVKISGSGKEAVPSVWLADGNVQKIALVHW